MFNLDLVILYAHTKVNNYSIVVIIITVYNYSAIGNV